MNTMDYATFLTSKRRVIAGDGITGMALPSQLFTWQQAIVHWALKKGRAAIFADCGLGKTFMQVAWANAIGERALFFAPLCVAEQTVREAERLGINVRYATSDSDAADNRLVITNYERIDRFDVARYPSVVLDESSILKSFTGSTRTALIEACAESRYRLCCTATPSPNDISELANHAEFLGLMTRPEFLATWFIKVDQGMRTTEHHGWRLKRHARQPFYRWLASWAMAVRRPSDLGFSDEGFTLPSLTISDCVVESEMAFSGALFPEAGMKGIDGRMAARRGSLTDRVAAVVDLVNAEPNEPWLLWCGLNDEAEKLAALIPGAVNVSGNDTYAEKTGAVSAFVDGRVKVLISKPRILGFGMNFQNCARMAFVGLSDSYETYYQAIRRCWRFGQLRPVTAWIVVSEAEQLIVSNVRRKEAAAEALAGELVAALQSYEREELAS